MAPDTAIGPWQYTHLSTLISKDNLKELIDHLAMLKINRLHFTQEVHDTTPEGQQKNEGYEPVC